MKVKENISMIKIEHLAIWVNNLERMKSFYEHYFTAKAGEKYHNPHKQFTSYFLSFGQGCRLELMHRPEVATSNSSNPQSFAAGLAHMAISLGSREAVDKKTEHLRADGYRVTGEPRTTGDGYYESVVLDPEGNTLELTV